jgi:ribonuclease-3
MGEEAQHGDRLQLLQDSLGYRFKKPELLRTALTHRSHSHESCDGEQNSYERLEFLGEALLGFIVAERLYRDDAQAPEGVLSRRRQAVVRESTLAEAGRKLRLGEAILLGRGEERTGGRFKPSLLADLFEAVLGAVYLDGGIRSARAFVRRHLAPMLREVRHDDGAAGDCKTILQELLQAKLQLTPCYRIVNESGPPHARSFEAEVLIDGSVLGCGSGSTRKRAEQEAARAALVELNGSGDRTS